MTAVNLGCLLILVSLSGLAAIGAWRLAKWFGRRAVQDIAAHVDAALAIANSEPHHLADMPRHPEHKGMFDDYTEQRYRRIIAPLEAEHHKPRIFHLADEFTEGWR